MVVIMSQKSEKFGLFKAEKKLQIIILLSKKAKIQKNHSMKQKIKLKAIKKSNNLLLRKKKLFLSSCNKFMIHHFCTVF